jgi:phospholipase/carboxylesterase
MLIAVALLTLGLATGAPDTLALTATDQQQEQALRAADRGRLTARPLPGGKAPAPVGLQPLGLGAARDGLIYAPASYRPERAAPLLVMLHGRGAEAKAVLPALIPLADETGLILLAPDSRGVTWDLVHADYGEDARFIDRALASVFARYAIDGARVALAGFSDGASYALSLGLTNGDLFSDVIAFSPGFMDPATTRDSPRVFVSHGTQDKALPIGETSRQIVPQLRPDGYDVRYREFPGGHVIPAAIAREAIERLLGPRALTPRILRSGSRGCGPRRALQL